MANLDVKNSGSNFSWFYKLILFLSFIWVNIFTVSGIIVSSFGEGFGNLLDMSNSNASYFVFMLAVYAFVYWIVFELLFYIYQEYLSYKIFSFIIPKASLKKESRLFYAYYNFVYGIFVNLCFVIPYLHLYLPLISIILLFLFVILYSLHINKKYAEPIIGHFVFKNFCYPLFAIEIIFLIFNFVGGLIWKN